MALQVSSSAFVNPLAEVQTVAPKESKKDAKTFPTYPFCDLVQELCVSAETVSNSNETMSASGSGTSPSQPAPLQICYGYWMPFPPSYGPYFWPVMCPWYDSAATATEVTSASRSVSPKRDFSELEGSSSVSGESDSKPLLVVPEAAPAKKARLNSYDSALDLHDSKSSASAAPKPRRKGSNSCKFSHEQVEALQDYFAIEPRPSAEASSALADKLDLTVQQVRIWFQNKRSRTQRAKSMDSTR